MTSPLASNLRRVRELLTPEGAWSQGAYAKDASGRYAPCGAVDKTVVSWCLSGATVAAIGDLDERIAARKIINDFVGGNIIKWNDHPSRTQPQVLAMLDRAIERAERG